MHGGDRIATVLERHGVRFLFTLCGGHISPVLVACKQRGIRVVDVRHEVTAVFAADAVSRLSGTPGVAAVTAGPGATNTITAIKNAQLAQSPLVLLVGAAPTALKGRGALQDIDQMSLFEPHVKWAASARRVRDLVPLLERGLATARDGVPGPVVVECPVDLLYEEATVRDWYLKSGGGGKLVQLYLRRHLGRLFAGASDPIPPARSRRKPHSPARRPVRRVARKLATASRPVVVVGSQALLDAAAADRVAAAIETIGAPVYLTGMARGLMGHDHPLHRRHARGKALREADFVLLAGVPCDFRLGYGRQIRRSACFASVNRSQTDLYRNRRPDLAVLGDPGRFLLRLAQALDGPAGAWDEWKAALQVRDKAREAEIREQAAVPTEGLNPVGLCAAIERAVGDVSVLVADGGDFVGTAAYIVRPRGPLAWLDPGPFGTLGVGAGFALGAKLCRPEAEVWILYGDGSVGYSLSEFDTFARHGLPVIAVVGNDGCWMQIAREQVEILRDDVGCVLGQTPYHEAVRGLGGEGFLLDEPGRTEIVLQQARAAAAGGQPVLVNALIGRTDFRKGSISM